MDRTLQTPDERLNGLLTEIVDLTGEDYVTAMCQALEERRDRLVSGRRDKPLPRVIRLRLEAEISNELSELEESEAGR
ncbi:MAG: hypothetical protein QM729_04555 [Solirubrobacterales bacterium]